MGARKSFIVGFAVTLLACGPGDSVIQGRVDSVLAHPDNHLPWAAGSVSKGTLTLTGMAPTDEARVAAVELVRQIPGIKDVVEQSVLDTALVRRRGETESCDAGITAVLEGGPIQFSGTTLARQSRGALDRIAVVLEGCPDASVQVAGHTDSSGSEAANQRVSERRARVVLDYLAG